MNPNSKPAEIGTTPAVDGPLRRAVWITWLRLAGVAVSLAAFIRLFDWQRDQRLVDGLWVLALVLWVSEVKSLSPGPALGYRLRRADVLPIVAVLAVFVAAWLPFYDNWRWAYTGDSFSVFENGYRIGLHGLNQNILSVHGLEDAFTNLWVLAYNLPILLFGPSFFWHRVGQLVVSCLSLAAIYTYFGYVLGRPWGVAIVVSTALNYVWLWFSYVSYGKIDSFIFSYLMLTGATVVWRQPERLGAWMFSGFMAALSLFFTPTAWSAVIFASALLGVFALVTWRVKGAVVFAVSFAIMATPILIEIPWFLSMTSRQTQQAQQWDYLVRIFRQIFWLPYDSAIYNIGIQGAFLHWPLGSWYVVGVALSALGAVPVLGRWLGVPAMAPALLLLLLWEITLLTLTNKGYAGPSTKRAYNLIPLQIFFAIVPAYAVYAWTARYRWLKRLTAVGIAAAIVAYGCINLRLIMSPTRGIYGFNFTDGLIELRQRFPERRVFFFSSRQDVWMVLTPKGLFQQAYKLFDQLVMDPALLQCRADDRTLERDCEQLAVLCYEESIDQALMQPLLDESLMSRLRFPLLNSTELICFGCGP